MQITRLGGPLPRNLLAILIASSTLLGASGGRLRADPAYEARVLPLVQAYCYDCHGNGEAEGSLDLGAYTSFPRVLGDIQQWRDIAAALEDEAMPPADAEPMPAEEREFLVGWIRELIEQVNAVGQTDVSPTVPRRLTRREYVNTLHDLVGVRVDAETYLPEDKVGATGFRNDATELTIPPDLLDKYLLLAQKVVAEAIEADRSAPQPRLLTDRPGKGSSAESAAENIIRRFGTRAFRRPLRRGEVKQYLELFRRVSEGDAGFELGIGVVAQAMLVSPHFLFRIETVERSAGVTAVNDYEMASRLSYLIWSSMPDDELLRLAREGRLGDASVVRQQVMRMLADDRAASLADGFVDQWLFSRVTARQPDVFIYPSYTSELEEAARSELKLFVSALFRQDRQLIDLIDCDYTYLNETLARHYEIDGIRGDALRQVSLTPSHRRGGLLGMARVLQRTSMADRTSPTLRGAWVLDAILGTPPPPPPPDVNNSLDQAGEDADRALSFRDKLELHAEDGNSCIGCHKKMDPIGFAMENYDGVGRWRTDSEGFVIDATGTMTDGRRLTGIADLKGVLMEKKEQFVSNLTHRFLTYALGRELTAEDFPSVNSVVDEVIDADYRASSLVVSVVQSFPFTHKKHPQTSVSDR